MIGGQDGMMGKDLRKKFLYMKVIDWQYCGGCLLGKFLIH